MANDADAVDVAKQEQAISRVREHGFTLLSDMSPSERSVTRGEEISGERRFVQLTGMGVTVRGSPEKKKQSSRMRELASPKRVKEKVKLSSLFSFLMIGFLETFLKGRDRGDSQNDFGLGNS